MHDMLIGPHFSVAYFNPHMAREHINVRARKWTTAVGKEADGQKDLFQVQCLWHGMINESS